jgi:uncharacterized protein (TIGR03382 family)
VALSRDRGRTWQRVMAFADIEGISRCGDLPATCLGTCTMLTGRGTLRPAVCAPSAAPVDAGAERDAGVDGSRAVDAPPVTGAATGCSCHLGGGPSGSFVVVLALLLLRRRRR